MKENGKPYSGHYGFVETHSYWPATHMVAPKEKAPEKRRLRTLSPAEPSTRLTFVSAGNTAFHDALKGWAVMRQVLLSFWTWFEIALCAFVGFLTQLVLWPITRPFDRRRLVVGRCFRLAGVTAARLTPFWRFGVYGDVPRHIEGRTVFVSNHEFAGRPLPYLIPPLGDEMAG